MKKGSRDPEKRRSIGARIRLIRTAAGLRQWQLAELIGSTQPSVCMYERGVLPDPLRLLSIARIGGTTVEWILTGRHAGDGSEEMERLPSPLYGLAALFEGVSEEDRSRLVAVMDRIRMAIASIEEQCEGRIEDLGIDAIAGKLQTLPHADRRALCAAVALQAAVRKAFFAQGMRRLEAPSPSRDPKAERPAFLRSKSLEALKGPLFRLDEGLLKLVEILEEPDGRAELELILARLGRRTERKAKTPRRLKGAVAGLMC